MLVLLLGRESRHRIRKHGKRTLNVLVDVADIKHHNRCEQRKYSECDNDDKQINHRGVVHILVHEHRIVVHPVRAFEGKSEKTLFLVRCVVREIIVFFLSKTCFRRGNG